MGWVSPPQLKQLKADRIALNYKVLKCDSPRATERKPLCVVPNPKACFKIEKRIYKDMIEVTARQPVKKHGWFPGKCHSKVTSHRIFSSLSMPL